MTLLELRLEKLPAVLTTVAIFSLDHGFNEPSPVSADGGFAAVVLLLVLPPWPPWPNRLSFSRSVVDTVSVGFLLVVVVVVAVMLAISEAEPPAVDCMVNATLASLFDCAVCTDVEVAVAVGGGPPPCIALMRSRNETFCLVTTVASAADSDDGDGVSSEGTAGVAATVVTDGWTTAGSAAAGATTATVVVCVLRRWRGVVEYVQTSANSVKV